jgi:cell division protein FtsI (penicillin-binding protein 3)
VFSIVVMLDTPRSGGRTGGVVAAPVFKRIAEAALRLNGVPPSIAPPPAVVVARRDPNPVTQVVRKVAPRPILTLPGGSEAAVVPDVRGLGARDALRTLARLGLTARMQGAGIVIEQTPEPGEAFEPGAVCALVLHRDPSRLLGPGGAQP